MSSLGLILKSKSGPNTSYNLIDTIWSALHKYIYIKLFPLCHPKWRWYWTLVTLGHFWPYIGSKNFFFISASSNYFLVIENEILFRLMYWTYVYFYSLRSIFTILWYGIFWTLLGFKSFISPSLLNLNFTTKNES